MKKNKKKTITTTTTKKNVFNKSLNRYDPQK